MDKNQKEKLAKFFGVLMEIDRSQQSNMVLHLTVTDWVAKNHLQKSNLLEYLQHQESSFTVRDFLKGLNIKGYFNNSKFLDLLCSYNILTSHKQHKAGRFYIVNHEKLKLLEG